VLQAYFDESGITPDSEHCVLMGFVATKVKWAQFDAGWRAVTASSGDFHAKRFFARDGTGKRVGQYRDLTDSQASSQLRQLAAMITSRVGVGTLTPIGAAVDIRAFEALSESERRLLTGCFIHSRRGLINSGAPTKPFFAAFVHCVTEAARTAKGGAVVDFMFDRNATFAPQIEQQVAVIRKHGPPEFVGRLGRIDFGPCAQSPGLQAADLVAYAYRRWLIGGLSEKPDLSHAFDSIWRVFRENRRGRFVALDKRMMHHFLSRPSLVRGRQFLDKD